MGQVFFAPPSRSAMQRAPYPLCTLCACSHVHTFSVRIYGNHDGEAGFGGVHFTTHTSVYHIMVWTVYDGFRLLKSRSPLGRLRAEELRLAAFLSRSITSTHPLHVKYFFLYKRRVLTFVMLRPILRWTHSQHFTITPPPPPPRPTIVIYIGPWHDNPSYGLPGF